MIPIVFQQAFEEYLVRVSVGEYMFEMLLDMDCNDELINEYFK